MADFAILNLKNHLDLGYIKVLVLQIFDIKNQTTPNIQECSGSSKSINFFSVLQFAS